MSLTTAAAVRSNNPAPIPSMYQVVIKNTGEVLQKLMVDARLTHAHKYLVLGIWFMHMMAATCSYQVRGCVVSIPVTIYMLAPIRPLDRYQVQQ